jgi:dTDP-4-amino-4,6-dideoxygalactose transaminase
MTVPPRRAAKLPLYAPWLGEEEVEAAAEALRSGWLGMGTRVAELEKRFAALIGCEHAVALNSCTAALNLTLIAAGVGEGSTVLTTPYTFTASAEAVLRAGASVKFVDIDPVTLNLRPEDVEGALTPDTAALLPVHIAGHPCDMAGFQDLASDRGVLLLDDAAHALMGQSRGSTIGSVGDATAFSFYPTKHITTIEGGMLTTNDAALADGVRSIRYHAMSRDTWARQETRKPWAYDVVAQGHKCNMTDVEAAIGLAQLDRLPLQRPIRERIATRYNEAFADLAELDIPAAPSDGVHAWHLYILQLRVESLDIDRDDFILALNDLNISAIVHYIPLHMFTHYQRVCGVREGDFPNAEAAYSRVISLPLWPGMDDQDTQDVIDAVTWLVKKHSRKRAL